jgi:hypothetical protein
MPEEFIEIMRIIKKLEFTDKPPYDKILELFKNCQTKLNISKDGQLSWNL